MDFRILGPLEVHGERGVVPLGGPKPRAVLAVLLLHPNEPVSAERLAIALFGEDTAASSSKKVQVHVSRLRKALGEDILTTTAAGYRLRVGPGELDADRFDELVKRGRSALTAGQAQEAAAILREAEQMWRGPPLADLADAPFAPTEIARLEEQQLAALEARVEADAAAGRHAELVSELRRLVAEHPTRERLVAQLMLALYRCGRQAEALDAYQDARQKLAGDLGVEPGPELRALQDAILHQDPSLKPDRGLAPLPPELASAALSPLVGRAAELTWLLERWEDAVTHAGTVIGLTGVAGMGKTRLVAELAEEVHRRGATVLYASGSWPATSVQRALDHAREATGPTLLVLDDAHGVGADVSRATNEIGALPLLVIAIGSPDELRPEAVLRLEPLGASAIRGIASLYLPDHDGDDIPATWLLEASGGIPRRVHEVAGQWARREAARRVGAVAGPAAARRAELRSMEDELAGGVVALQTVREHVEPADDDGGPVVCPFKGLASFELADARYFFGRERLVAEFVARLVGAPLLGIVGPSGSGKSSVLRAGLLPALADGVLPGSEGWQRVLIRPGAHPAHELDRVTAGLGADRRTVFAVDQFEETFTVCRDEDERNRFIAQLAHLAQGGDGDMVVLAIRADFYGRCATYPELARLLAANHVLVGAMRHVELRRAVVGPAERVGLHVQPELADALVSDVEDEPGALPLLSTALLELWQRRDGRELRLSSYEDTGGVHGAVARLAEEAFGRLDARQQALARRVLLRLAEVEPEGGVERRRLPLADLEAADGEGVRSMIGLLADARLLTVSAGSVEFAHEALLREWPRLRDWIEDDRGDLRVHRNLSAAEQEWRRLARDESALYRGARLAEARDWAARGDPGPTEPEREFLKASLDREERERRSHRRRLALAFGALALGVLAIAAIAVVAMDQRRDAVDQRNIAVSRELALQSANTLDADPELGLALALSAVDRSPTEQAESALRQATLAARQLATLQADSLGANAAAYSPDGRRVVTGGEDGIVRVWGAARGREAARLDGDHGAVLAARYAERGGGLAVGFEDGTLTLTDATLGGQRTLLRPGGAAVHSVAFSADGEKIAAALGDGTVLVLAAGGGDPPVRLGEHRGAVLGVDINADGSRVVSAGEDGTVRLWMADGGATSRVLYSGEKVNDVRLDPDGSRVLAVGADDRIRLFDARTGTEEMRQSVASRELSAAAFSADGLRFAVGGHDGVIRVWSVAGGPPVAVLRGQRSRVYDIGFGATSDRLVSAGDDGTVRLWDAGRRQAWTGPSVTRNIDFSPDGRFLSSGSDDGAVRVWEATNGRLSRSEPGPPGYTTGRFSPTADEIVIARDARSQVVVWRGGESPKVVAQLPDGRGMYAARFDRTGRRIVYVDAKGVIRVEDLGSGRTVTLGGSPKDVYDAQISPDGNHVAAGAENGRVLVWRLDRPARPERVLTGHRGHVNAVAYSPDGRIVTAGADRTVRVWDTGGQPAVVLRGHADEVTTAIFTRDGGRVLSSSNDGTLRLWDARGGDALVVLQSGSGEIYDVALSRDGQIATLGKGEVVRVFPCEVCGSLAEVRKLALTRAARPLTPQERERFPAAAG